MANGFGLWSLSGDLPAFLANMDKLTRESIADMGKKGRHFLSDNYTASRVADIITLPQN